MSFKNVTLLTNRQYDIHPHEIYTHICIMLFFMFYSSYGKY